MATAPWVRVVLVDRSGATLASWVLRGRGAPDLGAVDLVAAWHLAAQRRGEAIRLTEMCEELRNLFELTGLSREVIGQTEEGEDPVGVEEGVKPGDPVA